MKTRNTTFRRLLILAVVSGLGLVAAWTPPSEDSGKHPTRFPEIEGPTPWTDKGLLNNPDDFQFIIVSDRTGGHREGIFRSALRKINHLRPEFVVSVGDLIEGATDDLDQVEREWSDFRDSVDILRMRFFYVPGNHDIWDDTARREWTKRFGPTYYHFVYKGVLFLCLNTEDGKASRIGPEQAAFARQILEANTQVRWTLVFLHKPLWNYQAGSGWEAVEQALAGRPHTVFAGHRHRYVRYQRAQYKYYQLATTGGASPLSGLSHGRFDHISWVTMTADGPVMANLKLDGILGEDVRTEAMARLTNRLGGEYAVRLDTITTDSPGRGRTWLEMENRADMPLEVRVRWEAHPHLTPSPYAVVKTLAPGSTERLEVRLSWPESWQPTAEDALAAEVRTTYRPDQLPRPVSWTRTIYAAAEQRPLIADLNEGPPTLDGRLDDWPSLPVSMARPRQLTGDSSTWSGPEDLGVRFGLVQDPAYLYLGVEVRDDQRIHLAGRRSSLRDSIVLYLDPRPAESGGGPGQSDAATATSRDRTVRLAPGSQPGAAIVFRGRNPIDGLRAWSSLNPAGYTLEVAIPHASLDGIAGATWRTLRLNLMVRDVDTPTGSRSDFWWRSRWGTMESNPESGWFRRFDR